MKVERKDVREHTTILGGGVVGMDVSKVFDGRKYKRLHGSVVGGDDSKGQMGRQVECGFGGNLGLDWGIQLIMGHHGEVDELVVHASGEFEFQNCVRGDGSA